MHGEQGEDVLLGNGGNDRLRGGSQIDYLDGGSGNDRLYGGSSDDSLYGGDGEDELRGEGGSDYLNGGQDGAGDILWGGTPFSDSSSDTFETEFRWQSGSERQVGPVCVNIDEPQDYSFGDWLTGGSDCPSAPETSVNDILSTHRVEPFDDVQVLGNVSELESVPIYQVVTSIGIAPQILQTTETTIQINGHAELPEIVEIVIDTNGTSLESDDLLTVTFTYDPYDGPYNDQVITESYPLGALEPAFAFEGQVADSGNTPSYVIVYNGYGGNDEFTNDTFVPSTAYGGQGNDILRGGSASDILDGNAGDDDIYGRAGSDQLYGGNDNDLLSGGDGEDELWGEWGNDSMHGGDGVDELRGGPGDDRLAGSAAFNGVFDGGDNDSDELWGGGESDTFYVEKGWRMAPNGNGGYSWQCVNIDPPQDYYWVADFLNNQDSCSGDPPNQNLDIQVDVIEPESPSRQLAADLNRDGRVDAADAGVLFQNWGASTGDLNGDGIVDAADASRLFAEWGAQRKVAASPELVLSSNESTRDVALQSSDPWWAVL